MASQDADLALEMTEDALREASMYLRRWPPQTDVPRSGPTVAPALAGSASWDHQAMGERPRRLKGIEALAASTKKREKERAAWWMLTQQEREDAQQYMIGKHPNGPF